MEGLIELRSSSPTPKDQDKLNGKSMASWTHNKVGVDAGTHTQAWPKRNMGDHSCTKTGHRVCARLGVD